MKRWLFAALAFALVAGTMQTTWAGELRAGAAKVSITPTANEFPYKVEGERPFVGVHDDLYARALVLEDGTRRVAIVSLAVTKIPNPERVVKRVAEAAKVPESNVLVAATHTHEALLVFLHGEKATPTQLKEIKRLEEGAVAATQQAVAQMRPAKISFVRGEAFVNVNNGEEAGLGTWYDPKGSSDKTLMILRVTDSDGKPLALMLNYATHGEVMFRSVTRDGGYEVTGDLPGAVSRILEGNEAGAPVVLFTSAAEGDQLPLFKSLQPAAQLPATDEGAAGWGLLDLLARRLAAAAIDTLAEAKPGTSEVTIEAVSDAVSVPGQHYNVERPSGKILGIEDMGPVSIPVSVIRINDIGIAGVGADIASDIGRAIKAASPLKDTMVVTVTAGMVGYVLNDEAYVNPGHGALGSPVKPGYAEPALSRAIARMLK